MNIFILDADPIIAVHYHVDKHVLSGIREVTWALNQNWKNHICCKWTWESLSNWKWVRKHMDALHDEWRFRWGHGRDKFHKSYFDRVLPLSEPKIEDIGLTPFAQAVMDCKRKDPIMAYRDYYMKHKRHLAKWNEKRGVPYWYA